MKNHQYIAIEGCIGAGKTALAEKLAHDFEAGILLEQFADNPFLPSFYENPERYAFQVETAFLVDRFHQLQALSSKHLLASNLTFSDYFIDKCIIFAKNNLHGDEFNLYSSIFSIFSSFLPKPDLIVYLHNTPENLLKNIKKRGREYELKIEASYLENIQQSYLSYLEHYTDSPVLIIDTKELNFVEQEEDYQYLKRVILQKISDEGK